MNYTELDYQEEFDLEARLRNSTDTDLEARMRILADIGKLDDTCETQALPEEYERTMHDMCDRYKHVNLRLIELYKTIDTVQEKIETLRKSLSIFGEAKYAEQFSQLVEQFEADEGISDLRREYNEKLQEYKNLRQLFTFAMSEDMNRYICFT